MGGGLGYAASVKITAPALIREPLDLSFLGRAAARKRLEIDLGAVEWISPTGVAALLAACLGADTYVLDATVLLPESREVRTYLAQIGFLAELERNGWGRDDPDTEPDAAIGPHLPVTRLSQIGEVIDAAPGNVLHIVSRSGYVTRSGGRVEPHESTTPLFRGTLAAVSIPRRSPRPL